MTEIKPWQDRVKPGAFTGVKMEAMLAEIAELRARVAELESGEPVRPMSDEQIDAIPFTGFIPVSERGHSETEALRIFARLVEAHIK